MKFSDIVKATKQVQPGAKGWQTIEEVAKELGRGTSSTSTLLNKLIREGRVDSARVAGSLCKVFRVIK